MKKIIFLLLLIPLFNAPYLYSYTPKSGILDVIPKKGTSDAGEDKEFTINQNTKDGSVSVKKNYKEEKVLISSDNWENDTVYYKELIREGTWYKGCGSAVNPENINAEDTVYRLTMKLNNGKYMHVETFKGGKKISSDLYKAFIVPSDLQDYDIEEDMISNPNWIDSQKNIVEVFLIPSSDLNSVIAEKAYDEGQKIVHIANIEKISDQKAVVCYFDSQGNILNLTDPKRYDYGTIAIYEWDKDYNSKITITDLSGWPIAKF